MCRYGSNNDVSFEPMISSILFLLVLSILLYNVAITIYEVCASQWTKAMHSSPIKSVSKQDASGSVGTDWLRTYLSLFVLKRRSGINSSIL